MQELDKLIRKRGSIKAKVTIFSKFIDQILAQFPDFLITELNLFNELEERIERFASVLDEFEQTQMEIDQFSPDIDAQFKERENFDREFHSVLGKAKTCRNKSAVGATDPSYSSEAGGSVHSVRSGTGAGLTSNIRLPVIELPKFDGNYDNWLEFRDSFDSLIHQNQ